jgi:hypothetical protein
MSHVGVARAALHAVFGHQDFARADRALARG